MLPPAVDGWEEQGRRIARSLDDIFAVLIVGDDPVASCRVALGIARVQALHRRVAVGDLIGEQDALRVPGDDDPHGLADCFLYGASLNRVGRTLPGTENIFVLPSGSEPVATEEIYRHERWRRLTTGFREVEALLLLVARPGTPGLESLAATTDGVIAVGAPALGTLPVLGRIRAPMRLASGSQTDTRPERAQPAATGPTERTSRRRSRRVLAAAAVVLAAAGVGAAIVARSDEAPEDSAAATNAGIASTVGGAVAGSGEPAAPPVLPVNPQDSAAAAAYAVEIVKANTEAAAIAHLRDEGHELPAMTVVPITLSDGSRWYRVLAGAFASVAAAESLQMALRGTSVLAEDPGGVIRVPFALLALADADTGAARIEITRLRDRGLPAYGLRQSGGMVHVYIGAFESPEAAMELDGPARQAGVTPLVAYRIGRAF